MDMEGRALGTERPPTSTSPGAGHLGGPPAAGRFSEYLELKSAEGSTVTRQSREEVEDNVAARIRDGRTDSAKEVRRRESAVRDDQQVRDARADAERSDAARQADRASEQSGSSRRSAEFRRGSEAPSGRHGGELSGQEKAAGWTDAADAEGATIEPEDATEAPYGPTLGVQTQQPTGPMTLSMGAAAGPAPAISGVFRVPGTGQPLPGLASGGSRPPAAATAAGTRVETTASAPTNKAAPARPSSSLQRAEAILEQLKVRIQGGDREATINLNPVDLGRLRLHVKVDQGAIHASIAAESAETLAVLEAHAPELRAWLSRDGAESVELDLGLMTSAEADAQSRSEEGEGRQGSGSRRGQSGEGTSSVASPEALLQQLATRTAEGGVDLTA